MRCHDNTGISRLEVLCTLGSAYVHTMGMSHMWYTASRMCSFFSLSIAVSRWKCTVIGL